MPAAAHGQEVAGFYRGRQIALVIGYGAGGGYDLYARMLDRFMGVHVPGNPVVVPQNMPGAASRSGANRLFRVAPADATVIACLGQATPTDQVLGQPGVQFDARKFNRLGNLNVVNNILYVSADSGVTTLAQAKTKPLATSPSPSSATGSRQRFAGLAEGHSSELAARSHCQHPVPGRSAPRRRSCRRSAVDRAWAKRRTTKRIGDEPAVDWIVSSPPSVVAKVKAAISGSNRNDHQQVGRLAQIPKPRPLASTFRRAAGARAGPRFRSGAAALLMDDESLRSVAGDNARKLRISLAVYSGTGSIQ